MDWLTQTEGRLGSHQSNQTGRNTRSSSKISPELYSKVTRLFDKLKLCDTDNFAADVAVVTDPSSIKKVMMALEKVASKNWIKKVDESRYRRIMKNCGRLMDVMETQIQSKLSDESQMSGVTYDNSMVYLSVSPFEQMRDRVLHSSDTLARAGSQALHQQEQPTTSTTEASIIARLNDDELQTNLDQRRPEFIQFF